MARVREGACQAMVPADHFIEALKFMQQVARPSKLVAMNRTAVLEAVAETGAVHLTTTNLEWGASISIRGCQVPMSAKVILDLSGNPAWKIKKHAGRSGNFFPLSFNGIFAVGDSTKIPLGLEGLDPNDWPESWTYRGITTDSKSDVMSIHHPILASALKFNLEFVSDDYSRGIIQFIHLRRLNSGSRWAMESTDGHRAGVSGQPGAIASSALIHPALAEMYLKAMPIVEPGGKAVLQFAGENNDPAQLSIFASLKWDGSLFLLNRAGGYFLKKGLVDSYPPIERVIPSKDGSWHWSGTGKELHEAAKTHVAISGVKRPKKDDVFKEHDKNGILEAVKGDIYLVLDAENNHAKTLLGDAKFQDERKNLCVKFNPFYLLDSAAAIGAGRYNAWLNPDGCSPLLIEGESGHVLIMPIRA